MIDVVLRTDASERIGSGHVMRCLALARTLAAQGLEAHFICRELPGNLIDHIRRSGFAVHPMPLHPGTQPESDPPHASWLGVSWTTDAEECLSILAPLGRARWIVVDHYALDARWEEALACACERMAVIDDLTDRPHACDLLINQNLIEDAQARYAAHLRRPCRLLLGPRYALLRNEFGALRSGLARDSQRLACALVFLGGGGADGVLLRVLALLDELRPPSLEVRVVTGEHNRFRAQIEARFGARPGFHLQTRAGDMAGLIAGADVAVGAAGVSALERCCLGLPTVLLALAANQVEPAEGLAREGAALYAGVPGDAGDEPLRRALARLLGEAALRNAISGRGLSLVDGQGCERVAAEMLRPELILRPARGEDAGMTYAWRNAESTRRYARDPRPIEIEAHRRWFERVIGDPQRLLLIAEAGGAPVGVLRYDVEAEIATVSIYLDPARQGHGYGSALLLAGERWLAAHRPAVRCIRAEVLSDNAASRGAFRHAGFAQTGVLLEKGVTPAGAQATQGTN